MGKRPITGPVIRANPYDNPTELDAIRLDAIRHLQIRSSPELGPVELEVTEHMRVKANPYDGPNGARYYRMWRDPDRWVDADMQRDAWLARGRFLGLLFGIALIALSAWMLTHG